MGVWEWVEGLGVGGGIGRAAEEWKNDMLRTRRLDR